MFSVLQKLSWFFSENWKRYTIAIGLLLVVNIIEIIPPKVIGITIDAMKAGELTKENMLSFVAIMLLVTVSLYVTSYYWQYHLFGGAFLLEKTMRGKLTNHFVRMTPTFYQRNRTGDLMARATNDLKAISNTAGFGILTLVDSTMYMITILLMMGFSISWSLTFAAIIPLPIMAFAMNQFGSRLHKRFTIAQDAFGDMNDKVLESIAGVRTIRAYVQEKADEKRFHTLANDIYAKNMEVAKIDSLFEPTVKILVGLSYLIGLIYGAYLVFHNEVTIGELVSFNVYLGMMIWPMFAVGELINVMQRGNASIDRVNETLSQQTDVVDHEEPIEVVAPNVISFEKVSFSYPSAEHPSLKDITFKVKKGQTLGIVGRTGSGKTTLIRQLLRQFPLGEGTIQVGGVPLENIRIDNVLEWIGYVPQEHVLFSKTVKENIQFGAQGASETDLSHAIRLASLEKDIEFFPKGLATIVGEKGVSLSGGQKQRISIARAMIGNPEILILDDSLSAVDSRTEAAVLEGIRTERKGKTTIITTHRLSAVMHADLILVIDEGQIIEQGTHASLVKEKGWYYEQYERQQLQGNDREVNA